jgi:hypothetical protein
MLAQLAAPMRLHAQEGSVPADLQVALFAKILSFDRNLAARSGSVIEIVVLYQVNNPQSREVGQGFATAFAKAPVLISSRAVKVVAVGIEKAFDAAAAMQDRDPDVVYIAPMRALDVSEVIHAVADYGAIAITQARDYVQKGAAIGVELEGGRPHILVNLLAARAQRMDLSAQLLKLAELVGP